MTKVFILAVRNFKKFFFLVKNITSSYNFLLIFDKKLLKLKFKTKIVKKLQLTSLLLF